MKIDVAYSKYIQSIQLSLIVLVWTKSVKVQKKIERKENEQVSILFGFFLSIYSARKKERGNIVLKLSAKHKFQY